MNLAEALQRQVERSPEAIAVAAGDTCFTFREFFDRVARIAGGLQREHGLHPGDRVLLFMENRTEFLELLFACWMRGYCAVPVNARLHPREVAHIASDADVGLVVISDRNTDVVPALHDAGKTAVVSVDSGNYDELLAYPPSAVQTVPADSLAWLFYTSGTTGRPKGAMLSHANLTFMCDAYYADLGTPAPGDTQLHAAPLSHGAGMYALPHLLAGGRQQILDHFDPQAVMQAIAAHHGVSFFAAPTMVMRMVNHPSAVPEMFATLKFIVYGGAPMYVADLEKALALIGPRLYQLYGQGESPMTITGLSMQGHVVNDALRRRQVLSSCGYARAGVDVAVVNDDGVALPFGTIGEIVTCSPCVMAGYWKDSAATSAALRHGWLYTGDVGSIDADGLLTLHDRSKDLIISGGSNIYPREIEEVLLQHPHVRECAVIGRRDPDWGELPVAFIVSDGKEQISTTALEALLAANLARFKRPRDWYFVASLPKNNYGKVLKSALREQLARPDAGSGRPPA